MKIIRRMPFAFLAVLLSCATAHAQSGCINSPEAPTAVLLLVGTGAGLVSLLKNRR